MRIQDYDFGWGWGRGRAGEKRLLRGNEKASGSWTMRETGKREWLHRWMKARFWPARTRSRELWVSHIFADVRTTKSFSLAALFSTCKSCSVTALVRTKQPWLLRAEQKDTLSLFSLFLFESSIQTIQISVLDESMRACTSFTCAAFTNIYCISADVSDSGELRYLMSIPSPLINCNFLFCRFLFFSGEGQKDNWTTFRINWSLEVPGVVLVPNSVGRTNVHWCTLKPLYNTYIDVCLI